MAAEDTTTGQSGDTSSQQPPSDNSASQGTDHASQVGATSNGQPPQGHVPSYRLREQTEQFRAKEAEFTRQISAANARYADIERKLQAVVGVTPQSTEDREMAQARTVLEKMYPALGKLTPDALEKLLGMADVVPALEANSQHYWDTRGAATSRELFAMAKQELGGDLSERGQRKLMSAFVDYVQSDPANGQRYVNGDPEVVKDFWKEYAEDFLAPVKRSVGSSLINRGAAIRQPRGGASTPNAPAPKKPDYSNPDAVHNGAWDELVQRLNSRG